MKRIISTIVVMLIILSRLTIYAQATDMIEDTYIKEEYLQYIYEIAEIYGVQPELLMAIIEKESSGNANAVSISGTCYGLMQVNYTCHKKRMERLEVEDLFDPYGNILVGTDYLMELATEYNEVAAVLMHYHGERGVEKKLQEGKMSSYAKKILERSADLEELHYGL